MSAILQKLETQFATDTAPWRQKAQTDPRAETTEGQKARAMLEWFDKKLRPHLNEWHRAAKS